MLKIKCNIKSARCEKSWHIFCQIWIIFTHLKLWIASARHSFKWVKIQIEWFGGERVKNQGLYTVYLVMWTEHSDKRRHKHGKHLLKMCLKHKTQDTLFKMFVHRPRRWPDIKTALGYCFVFAGYAFLVSKTCFLDRFYLWYLINI